MKKMILGLVCMTLLLLPIAYAQSTDKLATDSEKISKILDKVKSSNVKFDVFGTEYSTNSQATIWLQYLKDFQPINNASCYMTAYYPNKTIYFSNILMNYLASSDGVYYYDFVTPSITGVYIVNAKCQMPANTFIDDFLNYNNLETYQNITIDNNKIKLSAYSNITLNPFGWWHLNELSGTNAFDSSGYGHNGTTINSPSWVAGKLNNALQLDGTTQYVDLGNNFGFEYNQSFSLEAWVYPSSTTGGRMILSKKDANAPAVGWDFQIYNGQVYMTLQNNVGGGKTLQVHTNDIVNTNLWQHIIAVYNGSGKASGIKIYVNGTNKFLVTNYDTLNNASISNIRNCFIGAADGSSGKSSYFSGKIDEVVIYNKVLTQSEIDFRYNNYNGRENMSSEINATSGIIRSIPITLNSTNWLAFNSDYDLKDGAINFKVLNSTNDIICSGLGDISACANSITPIKLYAELTKPENQASPEIDRWYLSWLIQTAEEVKGSGEMHISTLSCESNATASVNYTYFDNKFNDIYNWFVTTWANIANTPSNVWSYSPRTVQNITLTNATVTISDQQYDDIALRVIQYFYAMKDKLLTLRLW